MFIRLATLTFVLCLISSAGAAGQDCALSSARKDELRTLFRKNASRTPYGNSLWPCEWHVNGIILPKKCNFPPDTSARDLSDKEGNLILFRNIGQRYQRGFIGRKDSQEWIKSEGMAYSYSLSPAITWSMDGPEQQTLIAIQNLNQGLKFPISIEETIRQKYVALKQSPPEQYIRKPLTPETKINEIAYYDEVKVPVKKENVLLILPREEFRRLADSFGKVPYRVIDLLEKAVNSPLALDPTCVAPLSRKILDDPAPDAPENPSTEAAD